MSSVRNPEASQAHEVIRFVSMLVFSVSETVCEKFDGIVDIFGELRFDRGISVDLIRLFYLGIIRDSEQHIQMSTKKKHTK